MPATTESATIQACILCAVAIASASPAVGGAALAQTPPPAPPAANAPSSQAAVEQRIRSLQTQLQITDAQMPPWNAFAQAMRDNATSTNSLFRQRAGAAQSMSALDNMKSYALVARTYADNIEKLSAAFAALYGALSIQQKQTIDALFRQQSAQSTATQPARP